MPDLFGIAAVMFALTITAFLMGFGYGRTVGQEETLRSIGSFAEGYREGEKTNAG